METLKTTPVRIVYDDLDEHELRVLHLHPIYLLNRPVYKALSYVWGDPTVTSPIQVDGYSFEATVNLVSALRHIRRSDSIVVLWVDAVCINQKDIKERNHQVQMMAQIYRSAEKVIAWLGEAGKDSDEAMKLLHRWGTAIEGLGFRTETHILAGSPFLYDTRNALGWLSRINDPFDARGWNDISSIWKRPYWSRLRIVQEFVVSSSVTMLCGLQELRPEHLKVNTWWTAMAVHIKTGNQLRLLIESPRRDGVLMQCLLQHFRF